jgi:hypothetical protein
MAGADMLCNTCIMRLLSEGEKSRRVSRAETLRYLLGSIK